MMSFSFDQGLPRVGIADREGERHTRGYVRFEGGSLDRVHFGHITHRIVGVDVFRGTRLPRLTWCGTEARPARLAARLSETTKCDDYPEILETRSRLRQAFGGPAGLSMLFSRFCFVHETVALRDPTSRAHRKPLILEPFSLPRLQRFPGTIL